MALVVRCPLVAAALVLTSSAQVAAQTPLPADSLIVSGFIFNEVTGQPIDASLVIASADTAWAAWRSAWLNVPPQGHGRAVPRDAALRAYAPGYFSETRQAVVPNGVGRTRLDFYLRPIEGLFQPTDPDCDVPGTVRLEPDGDPVEHTQVWLKLPDGQLLGALATSEGSFSIADVPAGLYVVFAEMIGFVRESRHILVRCTAGEPVPSLTFLMRPAPVQLLHIVPGSALGSSVARRRSRLWRSPAALAAGGRLSTLPEQSCQCHGDFTHADQTSQRQQHDEQEPREIYDLEPGFRHRNGHPTPVYVPQGPARQG